MHLRLLLINFVQVFRKVPEDVQRFTLEQSQLLGQKETILEPLTGFLYNNFCELIYF